MAKSIKTKVITPEKVFFEGEVEIVSVYTLSGSEGFMANHAWATKLLDIGEMGILELGSKERKIAAIAGGFIDVKDEILIYTDTAEWSGEIDVARSKEALKQAEEYLERNSGSKADPKEVRKAQQDLKRAATRIKVATGGEPKH
jgi:F-type H+-transporting ATPase subunit epsilon